MSFEIDENDCKVIVKRFLENDEFTVNDFVVRPLDNDNIDGYSCKYAKLIVNINCNRGASKRLQFFCKTLLDVSVIGDNCMSILNKERFVYEYFCDEEFAAKFLYVKGNTLILEDLTLNGYAIVDEDYLDIDHLKLTLKQLAKLHTNSIVYEKSKGPDYKLIDEFEDHFREYLHSDNVNYVGHQFTECGKEAVCTLVDLMDTFELSERNAFKRNLRESMEDFYRSINTHDSKHLNVCNHGDVWRKNLMFRYEDGLVVDCKLIDFQICRYLPPAHDVIITIHHLGDNRLRKESYDYLLDYYYTSLTHELAKHYLQVEDILPRSEYELTCKLHLLPAKILRAIYTSMSSTSQESQKELFRDPVKALKVLCEDRSAYVTAEHRKNERYRALMRLVVENLHDALTNRIVTIEDCHRILKTVHRSDYVLHDYYFKGFDKFSGYLGEYKLLETVTSADANGARIFNSFFVKSLPKLKAQFAYLYESGGHTKEYGFFRKLVPLLAENNVPFVDDVLPKCHFFRLDDLAVFEDLIAQNYATLNHRIGVSYDAMKLALKQLARFHGGFYALEEILTARHGKPYRLIEHYPIEMKESFLGDSPTSVRAWNALIQASCATIDLLYERCPTDVANVPKNEFKERARNFLKGIGEYVKPSRRYRNTVCHGDLWASNVMFKFDDDGRKPVRCKFIDFQSYRYHCPTSDVLAFVYVTTDRRFRREHLDELLDYYYEQLDDYFRVIGHDFGLVLSYEDYLQSLEEDRKLAYAIYILLSQMTYMDRERNVEFLKTPGNDQKIMFEGRAQIVAKICENDEPYWRKIAESLIDLKEYLFPKMRGTCE